MVVFLLFFSSRYGHLELFAKAFHLIKTQHVHSQSEESMVVSAIKGILLNLDPYSQILSVKDFEELNQESSGKHYGIGIEVERVKSHLLILSVIKNSPAEKAGFLPGDVLLSVNDRSTKRMTTLDFKELLKKHESFLIHARRGDQVLRKEVKPKMLQVKSSDLYRIQEGLFYLKIHSFTSQTTLEVSQALEEKNIQALVIDLRFNRGGLLEESYKVADLFLQKGVLARYKVRTEKKERVFKAHHAPYLGDFPLVVLINELSASSSELLAAALQDQKRASLIGRKSFGKGLIQETFPLKGNYLLFLSVGEYQSPLGKPIHKIGITPDIILPFDKKSSFKIYKNHKEDPEVSQALKLAKALIKNSHKKKSQ